MCSMANLLLTAEQRTPFLLLTIFFAFVFTPLAIILFTGDRPFAFVIALLLGAFYSRLMTSYWPGSGFTALANVFWIIAPWLATYAMCFYLRSRNSSGETLGIAILLFVLASVSFVFNVSFVLLKKWRDTNRGQSIVNKARRR
jgi:hypothetical protein